MAKRLKNSVKATCCDLLSFLPHPASEAVFLTMAEEEIDNETLQAQIDLSLSFAQNLVSSWVKPALKPTKNSSRALEAELKEYMRRPPRYYAPDFLASALED